MRFRLLRKGDVSAVYRLGRHIFGNQADYSWDWSRPSIRRYLRRSYGFGLVCVDERRIIGFLLVEKNYSSQKPEVSWVTYVYVVPEYRRQDVGSQLLDRASARLRTFGKKELIADVYADNSGSIAFFTKRKFVIQERWLLLRRRL